VNLYVFSYHDHVLLFNKGLFYIIKRLRLLLSGDVFYHVMHVCHFLDVHDRDHHHAPTHVHQMQFFQQTILMKTNKLK